MKTAFLFLAMTTAACTINGMQRFNYSPPKPDTIGLIAQNDTQTVHIYDYDKNDLWWYDPFKEGNPWGIYNDSVYWTTTDIGQHWDHDTGGNATTTHTFDYTHGYEVWESGLWINETPIHGGYFGAWLFLPGDPNPYDYQNHDYTQWIGDANGISQNTPLGCEHCDVQRHTKATIYTDYGWTEDQIEHAYKRNAQTTMSLLSGGRGIPGRMILHEISGWVKDVIPTLGVEAQPPYLTVYLGQTTAFSLQPNVPNNVVHLLGGTLHDDPNHPGEGSLYYLTPEGAGPIDATPTAGAMQFYTWSLSDWPHVLAVSANSYGLSSPPIPDFCVGQFITFAFYGLPSYLGAASFNWTFGGHYFNASTPSLPQSTDCSMTYYVDNSLLTIRDPAPLWWVSGGPKEDIPAGYLASVQTIISFPNGQPPMKLKVSGPFNMYRPTAKISPVTTSVNVNAVTGTLELIFATTSDYGITFNHTVNYPKLFPGSIDWIQTISTVAFKYKDKNGQDYEYVQNGSAPYLDGTDPYQAQSNGNPIDSPGINLVPPHIIPAEASGSGDFKMTMMFIPPGGGMRVPLRAINWSWSGAATNSFDSTKGLFGWLKKDGTGSADPNDFGTEDYPHWESNANDYHWNPSNP